MKYVFVDPSAGGSNPSNATPDTSTSKYHTSATWPVDAGAIWKSLTNLEAEATLQAITDDLTILCRQSGSTKDTITSGGAQFDTVSYLCATLTVIGDWVGPLWDEAAYYLFIDGGSAREAMLLQGSMSWVAVDKMQVRYNGTSTSSHTAPVNVYRDITFTKSFIRGKADSTASTQYGIRTTATSMVVKDCIIADIKTSGGNGYGLYAANSGGSVASVYNNVVYNCDTLLRADGTGTYVDNNNALLEYTTIATGTWSHDYNASIGNTETNGAAPSDWTTVFEGYTTFDFRLKSTDTELRGQGIGPSADAEVLTTSINGLTRSGATTDIGPYLYPLTLSILSVDGDDSVYNGQTGVVILPSDGVFAASGNRVTLDKDGVRKNQVVTAEGTSSITITVDLTGYSLPGSATLQVHVPR